MKFTVAPDSLKESLAAPEAARAIARGISAAAPGAQIVQVPMADGGKGTVAAVVKATEGQLRRASVRGPLDEPVEAAWGMSGDGRTAVIEMAQASGLELVPPERRDPTKTSTYGTGQLIAHALEAGVESVVVGIGDSATVDGGVGMAQALGARFTDAAGRTLGRLCGGWLREVASVSLDGLDARLDQVDIVVASDVTNPLLGPEGAARVYGPQKGASAQQVEELEAGLANLAEVVERDLDLDVVHLPGAGAAGGLGAGLVAFLGARLASGARTVMEIVRLRERMAGSDLVFTAEGRADAQSCFGKATCCVVEAARAQGIPAVVLAGSLAEGYDGLRERGACAVLSILDGPMCLEEAAGRTEELLARTARAATGIWLAKGSGHG
ncbi:MAG: glycerate kinase [Candidatus Brocadiia bacterium]